MLTRRQFLKTFIGAAAGYYSFGMIPISVPTTSEWINFSKFHLAVISDIHVRHNSQVAQDRFKNALDDLTQKIRPKPDAIVINGDLGDGTPEDYATVKRIVQDALSTSRIKIPLFYTIGNHEFYNAYHHPHTDSWSPETFPNGENDTKAIERFLQFTQREKVYMDTYIKGYHLIFLGSEKSAMSENKIGDKAYLSDEQLNWLRLKLRENYIPGKPIFVFLHQPIVTTPDYKNHFIVQQEELNDILSQYPEVINFSGHLHLELGSKASVIQNIFTQYNDSSTARTLDMQYRLVPNKSEGLYVEVFPDKVNVRGRDFLKKEWVFR